MEPNEITPPSAPEGLHADTICAVSTAPGVGGIAVVRVSGNDAFRIVGSIWLGKHPADVASHTAHLGRVVDSGGEPLDQCVATVFRGPASFTGQDTVEISCHGSRYVQRELLASLLKAGARLAEPGEFTRRAFISGHLDLAQAEAVADVIASNSRAAHRLALTQLRGGFSKRLAELRAALVDLASLLELELDFSEEEVEFASRRQLLTLARQVCDEVIRLQRSFAGGQAIKNGLPIAIVGATNAGKSSLLNALLGDDRAIVSDIHGTTRDTIEETLEVGDYTFRFIDTAGLRDTSDPVEKIGIGRSLEAVGRAMIAVYVVDPQQPLDPQAAQAVSDRLNPQLPTRLIVVENKVDLQGIQPDVRNEIRRIAERLNAPLISLSAKTGEGLGQMRDLLQSIAKEVTGNADEDLLVTNARHAAALAQASDSALRVVEGLEANLPGDLIAQDLRETITHLSAITGDISSPEILATIFSRFCIGK